MPANIDGLEDFVPGSYPTIISASSKSGWSLF